MPDGKESALMFFAVKRDLCCSGYAARIFTRSLTLTTQALWEITPGSADSAAMYRPPNNGTEASWKLWLDWFGISVSLVLSFSFSARHTTDVYVCFVFIGISIDFKMMSRGVQKVHFWTLAVRRPPSGEYLGISSKWAAWDSIKESKWNVKLLHTKYWENFKKGKKMWCIKEGEVCCCCRYIT